MLQKLLALVSRGRRMSEVGQDGEMRAMKGNLVREDLVGTGQPWPAPGTELLGKVDKTTFDSLSPWVRPCSHISRWL